MGNVMWKGKCLEEQLHIYKNIFKMYPEVKVFEGLNKRALDALSNKGFSLDSVEKTASLLLEVDQKVVDLILENKEYKLENKKYKSKNRSLEEIADEYFKIHDEIWKFCEELENCLKGAKNEQRKLQIALQDIASQGSSPGKQQYSKIVEKLKDFNMARNSFAWDVFLKLDNLKERHSQMLKTLDAKKRQLEKKRRWIKFESIILMATFTLAIICCLAAEAIVPGTAGLTAALSAMVGSATIPGECMRISSRYDSMGRQLEVLNQMEDGTCAEYVKTIEVDVHRLVNNHRLIRDYVKLGLKGEQALQIVVDDIKSEQQAFIKDCNRVIKHLTKCRTNLRDRWNLVISAVKNTKPIPLKISKKS